MIEAYGQLGYTLWQDLSQSDLDSLLTVTRELRRDPKERKAERDRKEGERIIQETIQQGSGWVVDAQGNVKQIDFTKFGVFNNAANTSPGSTSNQQGAQASHGPNPE